MSFAAAALAICSSLYAGHNIAFQFSFSAEFCPSGFYCSCYYIVVVVTSTITITVIITKTPRDVVVAKPSAMVVVTEAACAPAAFWRP